MLKNENIICVSTMYWNDLWTRKQRFMEMLSKEGNKVLYVEPFSWIEGGKVIAKASWILRKLFLEPFGKLNKISDNLYVLAPCITIPFKRWFYFSAFLNSAILKIHLRKVIKKLNLTNPILWLYDPFDDNLIGGFAEKLVIYDCVDEHSDYPHAKKHLVQKVEENLIKKSNLVFVTTEGLYESKKHLNKNMFFIPNGVDVEHFWKAQKENTTIPEDVVKIPRPIAGFIGAISDWTDLDLVHYAAKLNPEWSFVLVGPVDSRVNLSLFKGIKNVYFLGRKKLESLPGYLRSFDVCINSFKINELTKAVNPLKVYEYLAAGKPVVSVYMPALRPLSDIIKVAKDKEEFAFLIAQALKENQPQLAEKRLEIAQEYSWEKLFTKLMNHIEEHGNKA